MWGHQKTGLGGKAVMPGDLELHAGRTQGGTTEVLRRFVGLRDS